MDTSIPAPSPALDTVPDTPRRDKPRRKTKPTSPVATTPSKKPRGTVAASSPESPKSPIPGYVYISATTSSKSISQMSKVNLVNEIVKKQEPSDDIITVEQAEQFPIEKLIELATVIRDSKRKTVKRCPKRVKKPVIAFDTPDSVVTSMSKAAAQATYLYCMRKLNKNVDKNSLNMLTMDDYFDVIFKYRKHLVTKEFEKDPDPFSGPTDVEMSDSTAVAVTQDDADSAQVEASNHAPSSSINPNDAPEITIEDEPNIDEMDDTATGAPNSQSPDGDINMDDPPPGTFSDEPASTTPSQAPPPVVVKQHFPNSPAVTRPSKPKVQSTHADRYTSTKDVSKSAFPNSQSKK